MLKNIVKWRQLVEELKSLNYKPFKSLKSKLHAFFKNDKQRCLSQLNYEAVQLDMSVFSLFSNIKLIPKIPNSIEGTKFLRNQTRDINRTKKDYHAYILSKEKNWIFISVHRYYFILFSFHLINASSYTFDFMPLASMIFFSDLQFTLLAYSLSSFSTSKKNQNNSKFTNKFKTVREDVRLWIKMNIFLDWEQYPNSKIPLIHYLILFTWYHNFQVQTHEFFFQQSYHKKSSSTLENVRYQNRNFNVKVKPLKENNHLSPHGHGTSNLSTSICP